MSGPVTQVARRRYLDEVDRADLGRCPEGLHGAQELERRQAAEIDEARPRRGEVVADVYVDRDVDRIGVASGDLQGLGDRVLDTLLAHVAHRHSRDPGAPDEVPFIAPGDVEQPEPHHIGGVEALELGDPPAVRAVPVLAVRRVIVLQVEVGVDLDIAEPGLAERPFSRLIAEHQRIADIVVATQHHGKGAAPHDAFHATADFIGGALDLRRMDENVADVADSYIVAEANNAAIGDVDHAVRAGARAIANRYPSKTGGSRPVRGVGQSPSR